jgi:hypothetical protein
MNRCSGKTSVRLQGDEGIKIVTMAFQVVRVAGTKALRQDRACCV